MSVIGQFSVFRLLRACIAFILTCLELSSTNCNILLARLLLFVSRYASIMFSHT